MKDWVKFKILLDEQYNWPAEYLFKFIIPKKEKDLLVQILLGHQIKTRPSKTGKYISVTSTKIFNSSDEVIEVYQKVQIIDGLMSL